VSIKTFEPSRLPHGLTLPAHTLRPSGRVIAAFLAVASVAAVGAALLTTFDPHAVVRALARADFSLIVAAVAVGAIIEVLRAQRAALMLRRRYPITLEQSFGAVVLSHAACRIVPIGPAGLGLQSLLTRRLASIPIVFSAGAFLACSILERLAAVPLLIFVLLTAHIPDWFRYILLGALAQTVVSLLIPLLAILTRFRLDRLRPRSRWGRKLRGAISDLENGLATIVAGGWRVVLSVIALSLAVAAGSVLRLTLLLAAFDLHASVHQIALLMVMGGLMGSMPVTVPGADAWATGRLLRLIHVIRPGAGGFVLLSSVIATVEAPLLAAGVLLWWALPHSKVSLRLGEIVALTRRSSGPQPAPHPVEVRLLQR
jgi:uncharacterized protein (TIRG00374 family)